jgi:hypothetical protein
VPAEEEDDGEPAGPDLVAHGYDEGDDSKHRQRNRGDGDADDEAVSQRKCQGESEHKLDDGSKAQDEGE